MKGWLSSLCVVIVAISYASATRATELRSGVVVDKSNAAVFLMQPAGGISAINTDTGETLWTSGAADKPLLAKNGRLLTQAAARSTGVISLRYLDQQSGALLDDANIAVAEKVVASIDEGLGQSFQLGASASDTLHWRFDKRTAKGTPDITALLASQSNTVNDPNAFNTSGMIAINSTELSSLTSSPAPFVSGQTNRLTDQLPNIQGRQFLSADEAHILVSQPNDLSDAQARYTWTIFTRSGNRLGTFNNMTAYSAFIVVNENVIFTTPESLLTLPDASVQRNPLSVRAVNLQNGQQLWQNSLRDTRYKGPFPQ